MPLTNGQIFAGYTIIRLLGSGAMGEVYLAQHPRLPRKDALKVLSADVSADADYRARFAREADVASTLWHPNIVGVHDRGGDDGQLWISMEFVDGTDAASLLRDRYPVGMPADEVATIIAAIASALDYAHQRGLLHRDVKPANILLANPEDCERRILLGDFGIARNVNDVSGLTKTNMTVGTVAYCAPEQLLGEEIDGRADQYSLAATAYHLLTGSQLFPSSNPAVVISRHLNVPPPALADSRPDLAKLDAVLAIGLAKQPDDRFRRCSDFARALSEQINPGVPITSAPTALAAVRRDAPATDAKPPRADPVKKNGWKAASSVKRYPSLGPPLGLNRGIKVLLGVFAIIMIALAAMLAVDIGRKSSDGGVASPSSTATSSATTLPTTASSTTASSTTASSSITSTTTPAAAPPPATRNTGTQSDINTLAGALSKGYSLNNCTAQNLTAGELAALSCEQSSDPNGPIQAKYILFRYGDDLAGSFNASIKDDTLTNCGDAQSPTTWHQGNSANAGSVACGTYQNAAEIIWTTDARNVLSYIRARDTDVAALYQWWRANG